MPYTQDDICIIHLSDLHIMSDRKTKAKIPKVLLNLIADIAMYTSHMKECIIAVSGDIINRAEYSDINIQTAIDFFKELKIALGTIVVKEIVFCPGNHDIKRGIKQYEACKAYMESGEGIGLQGYENYLDLINSIRSLWNFNKHKRSFYCSFVETNSLKVAFIALDLAWNSLASIDDSKEKKESPLSIGAYQLKELYDDFKEACIEEPDVVIFVSHYPLIFIEMMEQYEFLNKILSEEYFNADLYLCGHIHDVDTINYSTHEHSILSLVTGIGWPKSIKSSMRFEQRYSLYEINPIRNSCNIVMRKGVHNKFDYDYSVYTKAEEQDTKKIVYPLRIPHKNLPYISMKTTTSFDKDYFISSEMSDIIKRVSKCISEIQFDISSTLHTCKNGFLEQAYFAKECDKEMFQSVFGSGTEKDFNFDFDNILVFFEDYLMNNLQGYNSSYTRLITDIWEKFCSQKSMADYRNAAFQSYLLEICRIYEKHIKELFSSDVIVRPHFREYVKETDCYSCICFYPPTSSRPKNVNWGGLIKDAYYKKEPFIYSANVDHNATQTEWQEFITLVPIFSNYQLNFCGRKDKTKIHERPKLSFGISVKHCDDKELQNVSRVLTVFHYLQIQNDLSNMISYFVAYFGNPL